MSDIFLDRIPPQNIEAEQAVLGAIFLEREALITATDVLGAEDFYRTAHQRIFQVMVDLGERNEPVDLVTVTAELENRKQLDEVGGVSYLTDLATTVPTASNVEYYARIVEEKSTLRRLIRAATKIVTDGYTAAEDVPGLLGEAEKSIMQISQRQRTSSFQHIKDVLMETYEYIETLSNNKGEITGLPSGYPDLDKMTAGLKPSELIILAARPAVGKTAFALNVAQNVAARAGAPVAIFSLEMSATQLVQRMICAEGNIDAQRMRTGYFMEDDWHKLTMAIGTLASAPIYIDDTPGITISDIRSKCRRLKTEVGLGLILIDYLQLITGKKGGSGDNRQQEISEISRTLKLIARELECPVIALSQLSRAVEQRQDKRPMLSDIRESGCLSYDTLITRADTGEQVEIGSLVGQENIPVLSMREDLKLEVATISKVFSSGYKRLFELKTASGRTIKASANHPFYTVNGWKPVESLQAGNRVAVSRKVALHNHCSDEEKMSEEELGLLAHLIGDGCVLSRQPIHYTSQDEANLQYVAEAAQALFGIMPRFVKQDTWKHIYLPSPYRLTRGKHHPITLWFKKMGIWDRRSYEKAIPACVFKQPKESISLFLHHLWATDGCVYYKKDKQGKIYYSSTSKKLAQQVQHLLLRMGIISTLRMVPQGKHRPGYHVIISGKEMQRLFLKEIGCFGARGEKANALLAALEIQRMNPNRDIVPKEVWSYVSEIKNHYGLSWRKVSSGLETAYCGSTLMKSGLSRDRMLRLSEVIPDKRLYDLTHSDLYWDEIISITPLEIEEVFDATVPGNHNFLANDFIVHNSIEQDADMVAFLYRDDYYDKETERKNIIEVIIGKQRSGPTGTVELAFLKEYNKFVSLSQHDDGGQG
ncbi:replicative DNA helicase [Aneurinibacillus sp. REN35]|uniref:replicative DNA helicase n=1 Tax=Aneurinibacillus sp. REN35 TaxID=3237286 RepID=UPI00352931DA